MGTSLMSDHKPLRFVEQSDSCVDVMFGNRITGMIVRTNGGEWVINGLTSDRLLEIAIKIEDLNNAKAHTERESEEQSQSSS